MGDWISEAGKGVPLQGMAQARWSPCCRGLHAIRISVMIKGLRIHPAGDEQYCGRFS